MAMLKTLANAVSITSTGAQTGVLMDATPFLDGRNALVNQSGVGGSGSVTVQSSPDNTNWTTVATLTSASLPAVEVTLGKYMRINVGTAGTGTLTVQLRGIQ